ncbi:MAG: hypothetical protein SPJ34_06920 [Candidatus Ornithospirochaeta sp.]|nr:hypothetical protein [Candidatus Ornithospirochaeta sp.]
MEGDIWKNTNEGQQSNRLFQNTVPDSFTADLDAISIADINKPNDTIVFYGSTPQVFAEVGLLENVTIEMYEDKLARGLFYDKTKNHGHSNTINKAIVNEVAENLSDPIAIFYSNKPNSIVALYDINGLNGN